MKHSTILIALIATCFISKAQTSAFCVQTNCPLSITLPQDSVQIFGQANLISSPGTTAETIKGYQWKIVSIPPGATQPILVTPNAQQTMVRGLKTTGTYIFSLTVNTSKGQIGIVDNDVVNVNPKPAPPRTLISGTIQVINGVITIVNPVYSDGKP